MVVLTDEVVLAKTKAESLESVKNLNLWGSDLTDVSILQVILRSWPNPCPVVCLEGQWVVR
jgi:hypothetical protein